MALRVGFIGLGNIGLPMAEQLVPAGFETTVCDLAEAPVQALVAAGAKAAATPAELASRCDVIGICVPTDEHVRAVVAGEDGILAGAAPGTVIAVHSTILPRTVTALAELAAEGQVGLLDACVTGGAARAKTKTLTYLVGGDAALLEKARPYLECNSEKIIHAGELGNGAKLKLCINLVTYIQWAAAFESFSLAKAIGLPTEVLEEAGLSNGQITPLMVQYLATQKLPDEARNGEALQALLRGHMDVAEKDLAWALALAREAGVSLPVGGLVSQLMARIYGVLDDGRR
jgi:3-hydroxyisobutyrate dehydrogenase-like beta-hydroxyacid dehydrogenase